MWWTLWLGCAAPDGAALPAVAGPPPGLTMRVAAALPGWPTSIVVRGAAPGATVAVMGGAAVGAGPCPAAWRGGCVGLTGPYRVVVEGPADAAGVARLSWDVSEIAPLAVQAVTRGARPRWSAPAAVTPQVSGRADRGVWMWRDGVDGLGGIVGDPAAEDDAVQALDAWSVDRVYASHDWTLPLAEIGAFNARLRARPGGTVELLLSENTWILASRYPSFDSHLAVGMLDLPAAVGAAGAFDGVHLDVEPHGLPDWSTITPAERRQRLIWLADLFDHTRAWLDTHGLADRTLRADLPVWYDDVPGPIGWLDAADRDAWFDRLAVSLDGISLMAYERPTQPRIEDGVAWERASFAGDVRTGLEMAIPATWPDLNTFATVAAAIEDADGGRGVDVHDYVALRAWW
jgi:hypothetical protein